MSKPSRVKFAKFKSGIPVMFGLVIPCAGFCFMVTHTNLYNSMFEPSPRGWIKQLNRLFRSDNHHKNLGAGCTMSSSRCEGPVALHELKANDMQAGRLQRKGHIHPQLPAPGPKVLLDCAKRRTAKAPNPMVFLAAEFP